MWPFKKKEVKEAKLKELEKKITEEIDEYNKYTEGKKVILSSGNKGTVIKWYKTDTSIKFLAEICKDSTYSRTPKDFKDVEISEWKVKIGDSEYAVYDKSIVAWETNK